MPINVANSINPGFAAKTGYISGEDARQRKDVKRLMEKKAIDDNMAFRKKQEKTRHDETVADEKNRRKARKSQEALQRELPGIAATAGIKKAKGILEAKGEQAKAFQAAADLRNKPENDKKRYDSLGSNDRNAVKKNRALYKSKRKQVLDDPNYSNDNPKAQRTLARIEEEFSDKDGWDVTQEHMGRLVEEARPTPKVDIDGVKYEAVLDSSGRADVNATKEQVRRNKIEDEDRVIKKQEVRVKQESAFWKIAKERFTTKKDGVEVYNDEAAEEFVKERVDALYGGNSGGQGQEGTIRQDINEAASGGDNRKNNTPNRQIDEPPQTTEAEINAAREEVSKEGADSILPTDKNKPTVIKKK